MNWGGELKCVNLVLLHLNPELIVELGIAGTLLQR